MIRQNRRPGTINNTCRRTHETHNDHHNTHTDHYDTHIDHYDTLPQRQPLASHNRQTATRKKQTDVVEVDLSKQDISDLETQLDAALRLQQLERINLEGNQLESIPPAVFNRLLKLVHLDVSHNRIAKLSFPYFRDPCLQTLKVSGNCLGSLNLEHLAALQQLHCQDNELSFLTLPPSLRTLHADRNRLSNLYFLENCSLLQRVTLADNLLYDLKLTFRPSDSLPAQTMRFPHLASLDCSRNRIQHLEGTHQARNLTQLLLPSNQLTMTREILNQLLVLTQLQELDMEDNPQEASPFPSQQVELMLIAKLPQLALLNQQQVGQGVGMGDMGSERKSTGSFREEPYQLFMSSNSKEQPQTSVRHMEWNFTLGDCEDDRPEPKITDLSEIEQIPLPTLSHNFDREDMSTHTQQTIEKEEDLAATLPVHNSRTFIKPKQLDLPRETPKQLRITVVKSASPLQPHHVHYQPFLTALLPMSYVLPVPLSRHSKSTVSALRLDESHDDYQLIAKMFESRGGVVYVRKVCGWGLTEEGEDIWGAWGGRASMGFLLGELGQSQFRELCRFQRLVKKGERDVIGQQPNVFSCYHVLVRHSPSVEEYPCCYFIESSHL